MASSRDLDRYYRRIAPPNDSSTTGTWLPSRDRLRALRSVGDAPADELIANVFDDHGHEGVGKLMDALLDREWVGEGEVGQKAEAFLTAERQAHLSDATDLESVLEAGQSVFAEHGPEIILILGCYSLPAAYATANGVQVLRQSDYLTNQPNRRLIETAQIVVDVMQTGGLKPGGIGLHSAEKTRIMHAAIRHLIMHRPNRPWDAATLGVPINQEDLAATLMTFAYIALDGLDRMGITTTAVEKESYLAAWREVGRIMGVLPELLPPTFADAERLTRAIESDQVLSGIPPSDPAWANGKLMTGALLEVLDSKMIPGVPSALMRMFLPADVADGLGVPRRPVPDWVVRRIVRSFGWLDRTVLERFTRSSRVLRHVSFDLLELMLQWERGGNREPFRIPDSLDWYDHKRDKPNVGQRLLTRSVSTVTRG